MVICWVRLLAERPCSIVQTDTGFYTQAEEYTCRPFGMQLGSTLDDAVGEAYHDQYVWYSADLGQCCSMVDVLQR
jgi:hypothetical protein